MQKEIRQVPVYKEVQEGTVDKEVFITNDGKSFNTEEAALKHEADQLSKANFTEKYNLTVIEVDDTYYDVIFIKALNKETLIELERKYRRILRSSLRVGINLIYTDSSGDYDYSTVEYPDELISGYARDIASLKALKESYRHLSPDTQENL